MPDRGEKLEYEPLRISQAQVDWLEARERIDKAHAVWADPGSKSRVLVICGASRNDGTCPGEISKSFRLAKIAGEELEKAGMEVDLLDLSLLTSEYGRPSTRARVASRRRCRCVTGPAAAIRTIR